jgi:hypothetical protein
MVAVSLALVFSQFSVVMAASLVVINGDGARLNVLGMEEGVAAVQETTRVTLAPAKTLLLSLEEDGQRLTLGSYTMDVSAVTSDLVTVEVDDAEKVMVIKKDAAGYRLSQGGLSVAVPYPMTLEIDTHKLAVASQIVGVSPAEIAKTVLRAKYATKITAGEMKEEGGLLFYEISGEKSFSWGKLWRYDLPVAVRLSATDGSVVEFKAPYWYKLLRSFLV